MRGNINLSPEGAHVLDELTQAHAEAKTSWNLEKSHDAYQAVLRDLKPGIFGASSEGALLDARLQRDVARRLKIIDWETEGTARHDAADPHGLAFVSGKLMSQGDQGQKLERSGHLEEGSGLLEECVDFWMDLEQMHPDWKADFVQQQIRNCFQWIIPGYHPRLPPAYYDPVFGTPLTV